MGSPRTPIADIELDLGRYELRRTLRQLYKGFVLRLRPEPVFALLVACVRMH